MQKGFSPSLTCHCTLASRPFVHESTPGPSLHAKRGLASGLRWLGELREFTPPTSDSTHNHSQAIGSPGEDMLRGPSTPNSPPIHLHLPNTFTGKETNTNIE
ncbi:unnamed protein product [Pleuronectes platessa]|uniref:Uncharacterized protein n=1 Tax=Pleuronectes platessa TaxID=8262 RepID=A0A9N7Z6S8_PLEPL|nr:unnamed protein product [Pleuronectes platessa]